MIIRSNFEKLRHKKAFEEDHDLSVRSIAKESGLSDSTIQSMKSEELGRIDGKIINALCNYFGYDVGELVEHVLDEAEE